MWKVISKTCSHHGGLSAAIVSLLFKAEQFIANLDSILVSVDKGLWIVWLRGSSVTIYWLTFNHLRQLDSQWQYSKEKWGGMLWLVMWVLEPPLWGCVFTLSVCKLAGLPHNLLEWCFTVQERTHYILVQIQINRQIQEFSFNFSAAFPTKFIEFMTHMHMHEFEQQFPSERQVLTRERENCRACNLRRKLRGLSAWAVAT